MKKLVLILLISLPIVSSGQRYERVSGYMGKRLTLGLGIDVSPSNQPQKPFDGLSHYPNELTLNRVFTGQMQYVLGSYFSLVGRIGWSRTSANLTETGYHRWKEQGNNQDYYLFNIYGTPDITEISYGFNLRWYLKRKGALAPLGTYLAFGAQMHQFKFDYSAMELNVRVYPVVGDDYMEIQTFNNPIGNATYPEVYLEMGSAMASWNSFVFEVSGRSGFLFTSAANESEESETGIGQDIADELRIRVRNHYFFNLGLRISYLL